MNLGTFVISLAPLALSVALTANAAPLTIDSAAALARSNNAEVVVARFAIEEARGRLQQAGRHANPELEGEFKPNVRGREGAWQLGFNQKLPLTSRLRLERAVSRAELGVAEAEVRELERKVALETRLVAVRIAALDAHRDLRARQLANSRELADASRKSAARGEVPALESAQLELETARLEAEQLEVDAERQSALDELRTLIGMEAGTPLEFRDELPAAQLPPSVEVPVNSHSEVQTATARVQAAQEGVALARAQRWEDATFGLFGEMERDEDEPGGRRTDGFVGVRLALPLPFWNRNEGRRHEAEAVARRAEAEASARARHIRAEAHAARSQMLAAMQLNSNLATNLLPRATSIEENLRSQTAQGQVTFPEVLRARERRLELECKRLETLRDFHLARVRYESATSRNSDAR